MQREERNLEPLSHGTPGVAAADTRFAEASAYELKEAT
jgi:hypothetical protein